MIVLMLARLMGELASDEALKAMLADIAEIVRQVGRDHHQDLHAVALPVAGIA